MAVKLSTSSADPPSPREKFLVLISVKGCIDFRDIVQLEGLRKSTYLVGSSEIEPSTFLLVA
jgi:hypothetical protein